MKKIVAIVENDYEELELWYPKIRLQEAGHQVVVAGPKEKELYRGKHGYPIKTDMAIDELNSNHFDALLIPGGYAPDKLRRLNKVLSFTAEMDKNGKIMAFICHGGWVPISAKILKNRKATSFRAIKDDMENAGVIWTDEAVVVDRNLISSRRPEDLAQFGKVLVSKI